MEDNKIKVTKMWIQKTNQEKVLDMEQLWGEILDDAALLIFQSKFMKALKIPLEYWRLMKDQIL